MKLQDLTLITIFCFLINSNLLFSQTITEEEKQRILSDLSYSYKTLNADHNPYDAAKKVIEFGITEAEPVLINNIWKQDLYTRELFLHALNVLKSPRTHELTLASIDSTDTFKFKEGLEEDRLEYKAIINEILFDFNDFSKRKYVYDYIESNLPKVGLPYRLLLEEIITKYSKEELPAKNYLIKIAKENIDDRQRVASLLKLYEIYGTEILPVVMESFVKDTSWFVRNTALTDILGKNKTNEIHTVLLNRALADPDDTLRIDIADSLLNCYGSPVDFQIAKTLYTQLKDTSDQSYLKQYILDKFTPHKNGNLSVVTLIDSLLSYHSQCTSFNWLGNNSFSEQLKPFLLDAKTKLANSDSLGAAIKIKQYQSAIVQAYQDPVTNTNQFVTLDGYKFLYHYPKYILERLPKLPTVKLEDSQGKLLNGTLQYYEGAWKDAVNNNDGIFTVPTALKTFSLRMNYAYSSQTKNNVTVGADTVVFQTVNALVKLQNSFGAAIDTGKVQYYAGAWREFGSTANGIATKELLPGNYSFRTTYAYASIDKAQDIGLNTTVVF